MKTSIMMKFSSSTTVRFWFISYCAMLLSSCGPQDKQLQAAPQRPGENQTDNNEDADVKIYQESVQGGRNVLVIIPGFLGAVEQWRTLVIPMFEEQGFKCVILTPELFFENGCRNGCCCAQVDACCVKIRGEHCGFGSIETQAENAYAKLKRIVQAGDKVHCLGHSAGGLVMPLLLEMYYEEREKEPQSWKIEAAASPTTPYGGVGLIKVLSSTAILKEIRRQRGGGSYSCCFFCCIPRVVAPAFHTCGPCCCSGLTDLTPDSPLIKKVVSAVNYVLTKQDIRLLNIRAQCSAEEGAKVWKDILGGGVDKASDSLIDYEGQQLPITRQPDSITTKEVEFGHGIYASEQVRQILLDFFLAKLERDSKEDLKD